MQSVNQAATAETDKSRGTIYSWLKTCPPSDYNFTHNLDKADAATIRAVLDDLPEESAVGNATRIKRLESRLRKLQKSATDETVSVDTIVAIETALIVPSEFEPQKLRRLRFKDADLDRLGASIEKFGLQQPIRVRPRPIGKYEIVFGEQRYLASVKKGFTKIKCLVEDLSDAAALELQYEENHRRLESDPLEDAFFFQFLIETESYTSDRIADRFDLDVDKVRRFLKLNNLIRRAKEELSSGDLPLKHAIYLASYPPDSQQMIVNLKLAYKYHDSSEKATSFDDFKAQCDAHIIRPLSSPPFDPYDPLIHWSGLLCADCNERSDFPGQLFPELTEKASCLNKRCYDWKTNHHLKRQRERIAAQMPNPERRPIAEIASSVPLVTARSWTDEDTPFPEKVLTGQKLLQEPECEFSEASLIVDGERKGKEAFICRNEKCAIHNRHAAAQNSELKKKQDDFDRQVAELTREKVFAEAIKTFDNNNTPIWMFDDLIQKLIVTLWYSCDWGKIKTILRAGDWKNAPTGNDYDEITRFAASLDRRQQSQLIFLFIHRTAIAEDVQRIAADYTQRDYVVFDAEARFELAPDEFKDAANLYLQYVKNGREAEIPSFWWGFDEEAADACELEVE